MNNQFMQKAIEEARSGMQQGHGGPFGACIVKNGKIIGIGHNTVVKDNDPTAHAEVNAIREACRKLNSFELKGCEIYSLCEPCPMCFGAIYWCRLERMYYGCTRHEAAKIGFDDQFIYEELAKEEAQRRLKTISNVMHIESLKLFKLWEKKEDKVQY